MSEVEVTDPITENEAAPAVDDDSEKVKSDPPREEEESKNSVEPKSDEADNDTPAKSEEPEKQSSDVEVSSAKPTSTAEPNKPGECNLLPVLVERLRSALELSCSSQSSEDPQPLEDSGVDSEEDLRMWASGLCHSIEQSHQSHQSPKPVDLKFLEDFLLSDIQSALSRLQDTLKRVDVNALTKYSATLDSTNKLNLLRLISNLLSKLNISEEGAAKPSETATKPQSTSSKRRRANRHTIAVSAEEVAQARRLLEENPIGPSVPDSAPPLKQNEPIFRVEKQIETSHGTPLQNVPQTQHDKPFEQARDKHTKDAINQQQTYYNKNNKESYDEKSSYPSVPLADAVPDPPNNRTHDSGCRQEDSNVNEVTEYESSPSYYEQSGVGTRYNKFIAKKSKIKRANTIDIPNYLKLQAENFDNNQAVSLRRPVEVGDKSISSNTNIIPAFKPKTDNDRKFLALINKNNDAAPSHGKLPFRSFNYRQPADIDKNWNNRFSNIKTTFDKQPSQVNSSEDNSVKSQTEFSRKSQSGTNSDSGESEGVVVGSLRLAYVAPSQPKQGGFTHAPTSPFQKIEKSPANRGTENASIFKSGYLPKGGSSLQDKVKIFNQENANPHSIVAQNKSKFNKPNNAIEFGNGNDIKPNRINFNGRVNHNPAYNRNNSTNNDSQTNGSNVLRSYLPGNRNVVSSKLIVNANVANEERTKMKPQYPYSSQSNSTIRAKVDKIQANNEQNNAPFKNPTYYPEKLYNSYAKARDNNDVPARTSSHSFMLKKIADENNVESKPVINRYLQDALPEKDNKRDSRVIATSVLSKYVKPSDDYSHGTPQTLGVKNTTNTLPVVDYSANSIYDSNKATSQEYPSEKANVEYNPFQGYQTKDRSLQPSSVMDQSNYVPKPKIFTERAFVTPGNYSSSYEKPTVDRSQVGAEIAPVIVPDDNRNPIPTAFVNNPVYDYQEQSYVPYQTYETRRNSNPTVDPYGSRPNSNYYDHAKPNDAYQPPIDQRQFHSTSSYQTPVQSQPVRYNANPGMSYLNEATQRSLEAGNFDKEVQTYVPQPPTEPESLIEIYQHRLSPSMLADENIQNQDISSAGIVTRYQCAIATVATTPESSEPDIGNDVAVPDAKLYDSKVSVYPAASRDPPTTQDSKYGHPHGQGRPLDRRHEPQNEVLREDAANAKAFDEIQRHNFLQQQIIQKLQHDDYTGKTGNRRSFDTGQWNDRSPTEVEQKQSFGTFKNEVEQKQSFGAFKNEVEQKQSFGTFKNEVDQRTGFEKFKNEVEQKQSFGTFKNEVEQKQSFGTFKNEFDQRTGFEKFKSEARSPGSPVSHFPFNKTNNAKPSHVEEPVIESNNTLEKINIFEGKSFANRQFRPLSIPKFDKLREFTTPKVNVVTPSKVVPQCIANKFANNSQTQNSIVNSETNVCDSSDEYLMSCANRRSRSIVLSKSESWHQLALTKGNNLQPSQTNTNALLKPPKPKSPASLRLSKQYEATSSSDSMKRMEEKIQRYFHSPTNVPSNITESTTSSSKRESKSKRHFSSKKNPTSGLVRSHTMPHLYDDKLFDETDVDKAFDSLFQEATKADHRC